MGVDDVGVKGADERDEFVSAVNVGTGADIADEVGDVVGGDGGVMRGSETGDAIQE
jgi:hypothetical protein